MEYMGRNQYYQLGVGDKIDRIQPDIITDLLPIIDIECAGKYSIALCNISIIIPNIIKLWILNLKINKLSQDIMNLIHNFCDFGIVYKTRYTPGLMEYATNNKTWHIMKGLKGINIRQIASGSLYSLLLDDMGIIWGYGINHCGQLALQRTDITQSVCKLRYFSARKIWIKDIACGECHNIVIDNNGNVYIWGDNRWFQLGHMGDNAVKPMLLGQLRGKNVIKIGCGIKHSYAMTNNGDYYFWGSNWYHECLQYGSINRLSPIICDKIIRSQDIKNVYLGNQTTMIIMKYPINS